jgi:predicted GIY-YIG superfamily endonuclease
MGGSELVCCYIVVSHRGIYYTGITNNLIRRWKEHNKLGKSWLSLNQPKLVIHLEYFDNRREAAQKERYIKKIGAKKYLLNLQFKQGIQTWLLNGNLS